MSRWLVGNDAKTAIRNEVNRWMRTTRAFDAVLDFDRVVRDPAHGQVLRLALEPQHERMKSRSCLHGPFLCFQTLAQIGRAHV